LRKEKRYKDVILSVVSGLLVTMLLVPMGLKLEHSFSFHSKTKECKHSKTHIHETALHNDVLDYFFQPLAQYHQTYTLTPIKIIRNNLFENYQISLNKKRLFKLRLRGPPTT